MSGETVLTEVKGGVGTLTLNRPEVRNALNPTMIHEIDAALRAFDLDPEARVVLIRGAGDRAFCAGADLKAVLGHASALEVREHFGGIATILEVMARMRKPIIAQVHGYALAGGCGLAAGCDLVVASEDAVFGLPEIKIGLLPLIVMAPILRSIGRKRGLLMVLSGDQINARDALEMGLVSLLVPRELLETKARELAEKLAGYSPLALALAKEGFATIQDMEYGKSLHYLRELSAVVALSDDAKEGIGAFFEKRPPRWTGR